MSELTFTSWGRATMVTGIAYLEKHVRDLNACREHLSWPLPAGSGKGFTFQGLCSMMLEIAGRP